MSVPDELRRYVPRTDLYDSLELVHYHMPVEQPPATASYIIFKKGNKTYAKNGVYGHIEYENTDSAAVINNARSSLSEDGGIIFIRKGTYSITQQITLDNNIQLVGEQRNTTKLVAASTLTETMIRGQDISNITIANLTIDQQSASTGACIHLTRVSNSKLINIHAKNGKTYTVYWDVGGEAAYNENNIIQNCIFEVSGSNDLFGGGKFKNSLFIGNIFKQGYASGIALRLPEKCQFIANIAINNGGNGISLETGKENIVSDNITYGNTNAGIADTTSTDGDPERNQFIANFCYQNKRGISVVGEQDIIIGNRCELNEASGIEVAANHMIVKGNVCLNNGTDTELADTYRAGIRIPNSTDCIIVGNRCFDNQATKTQLYGILEAGTADYNIIVANNCRGNATSGITTVGTNTITANNLS